MSLGETSVSNAIGYLLIYLPAELNNLPTVFKKTDINKNNEVTQTNYNQTTSLTK